MGAGQPAPSSGEGNTLPALEGQLAWLLRVGVLASAVVLLIGGGVFLVRHGHEPVPDRRAFTPEPVEHAQAGAITRAALAGRGRALIQLGLLLLIATPIVRVAYSVAAFARRRDLFYTLITLVVLAVLLYGLRGGQG